MVEFPETYLIHSTEKILVLASYEFPQLLYLYEAVYRMLTFCFMFSFSKNANQIRAHK